MKGTAMHALFKKAKQSSIKELALTRFSDSASSCTICDIFLQLYSNQFLWT